MKTKYKLGDVVIKRQPMCVLKIHGLRDSSNYHVEVLISSSRFDKERAHTSCNIKYLDENYDRIPPSSVEIYRKLRQI